MNKQFILVICLLFNLCALAQSTGRLESTQFIQEGDNFLRAGAWNEALTAFNNAVNADPLFADAYMKRAILKRKIGSNLESDADYRRAIELNPYSLYLFDQVYKLDMLALEYSAANSAATKLDNANAIEIDHEVDHYIDQGAYKEALVMIDQLIQIGFKKEFEYEKKALVHLLLKDYKACELFADSALLLSNNSALAYDLKGLSQLMQGQLKESISSLSKAIEINPAFSVAHLNRAVAFLRSGNNDAALEDLNKSIQINQEVAMTYYLQGMLLQQKGNTKQSLNSYNAAIKIDSSYTKALFNRSFTWKMMGDFTKAMNDANAIVKFAPESPEYWNLKGNLHTLYSEYHEAIKCYNQAITLKPSYQEAIYNRGLAYMMNYAPVLGCQDLEDSKKLGYKRAEKALLYFCNQ